GQQRTGNWLWRLRWHRNQKLVPDARANPVAKCPPAEPGRRLRHRRKHLSLNPRLRRFRRRAPHLAARAMPTSSRLVQPREHVLLSRATLLLLAALSVPLRQSRRSFRSPVIAAFCYPATSYLVSG